MEWWRVGAMSNDERSVSVRDGERESIMARMKATRV